MPRTAAKSSPRRDGSRPACPTFSTMARRRRLAG